MYIGIYQDVVINFNRHYTGISVMLRLTTPIYMFSEHNLPHICIYFYFYESIMATIYLNVCVYVK